MAFAHRTWTLLPFGKKQRDNQSNFCSYRKAFSLCIDKLHYCTMSDSNDHSNDHNDDCSYHDPKKSMEFSPSVIEALAEYMQEQTEKLLREDLLKHRSEEIQIPDTPFDENWQLSQFWYNDDTIKALVRGALNSTPANGKIALVSCPSLYSRLKKECGERQIVLFEYDDRFKIFGTDFIQYDYNSPLDVSRDMASQFDLVIADPPYFAEECLTKTAVTIKFLTKKNIVLCTGVIMAELAKKLLNVKKCYFIPGHKNNLANEFSCYSNFDFDKSLE